MARIRPQTVRRFVGLPAWPFAYPIIITSDTSREAHGLRFTAGTRTFQSLDKPGDKEPGKFQRSLPPNAVPSIDPAEFVVSACCAGNACPRRTGSQRVATPVRAFEGPGHGCRLPPSPAIVGKG